MKIGQHINQFTYIQSSIIENTIISNKTQTERLRESIMYQAAQTKDTKKSTP